MIDFRYHLVSIVAVFLALAVGIVVGTSTIKGAVLDDLRSNVHNLTTTTQKQRTQLGEQDGQLAHYGAFAKAVETPMIEGKLTGQRVVVLQLPGASDALRSSLVDAVTTAGGHVSAQVKVTGDFVDPAQSARIGTLVETLVPAGVTLPDGTPQQRASALLAAVLTTRPGDHTHPADALPVLQGFADAKLVKLVKDDPSAGDLALFVASDPPGNPDQKPDASVTNALLDLVGAVDVAGQGAVVTGSTAAAQDSLVASVRSSGISDTVSTVDGADDPRGVIATIAALAAQPRGDAGAYGVAGADRPLPPPAP